MKRLTVLSALCTLLLFWKQGDAQNCDKAFSFTLGLESGVSINRAMVAGVNLGLNFKTFNVRGGFDGHLTSKVGNGAIMHVQLGHSFDASNWYITPAVGYAYLYKSADVKGMNGNSLFYNLEAGYKWEFKESPMAFYLSGSKAGEFTLVLIGLRTYF